MNTHIQMSGSNAYAIRDTRHANRTQVSFNFNYYRNTLLRLLQQFPIKCIVAAGSFLVLILVSLVIVKGSVSTDTSDSTRYYTSITVESEDTLWNIADRYNHGTENRQDYMQSIMQLNNMTSDMLYEGKNLIVYYYK